MYAGRKCPYYTLTGRLQKTSLSEKKPFFIPVNPEEAKCKKENKRAVPNVGEKLQRTVPTSARL